MGQFLTYAVEVDDGSRMRWVGDFRTLDDAVNAARHATDDPRARLAVVKDNHRGVMVYSTDGVREWEEVVRIG